MIKVDRIGCGKGYIGARFHNPNIIIMANTCPFNKKAITYYRNCAIKYNDGAVIIFGWLGFTICYNRY